jgi:hypothetical protein
VGLEFDTKQGDDLDTIRRRLAEAVAWFHVASETTDSSFPRSHTLHPSHFAADPKWVVRDVADRRGWFAKDHVTTGSRVEGRLLSFAPDETLSDGAAETVSKGFFDVDNEPPWDLWLGYVVEKSSRPREYVVCWVPPAFLQAAEDGIEVNPEVCIDWLPELERELGLGPNPSA